jgi:type IV pilus assembly protein PilA
MLARLRKMKEENEGGFTLIELLVVIIIIGILAAIAIPVFLNQRKKGYDAAAKSDLRNFATLEETYLTDYGVYGTTANVTSDGTFKASDKVTLTVLSGDGTATGFCLRAFHASSSNTWYYNSSGGGLLAKSSTCS